MVVTGPCPGRTKVPSGRLNSLALMPESSCGPLPPRSVRPTEPANRTSPPKTKGGSNRPQTQTTEQGLGAGGGGGEQPGRREGGGRGGGGRVLRAPKRGGGGGGAAPPRRRAGRPAG